MLYSIIQAPIIWGNGQKILPFDIFPKETDKCIVSGTYYRQEVTVFNENG